MPSSEPSGTYGNLYAYKIYTRPTARRLFGSYSYRKKESPKHHENVQRMLHALAVNGPQTTWGMAKTELPNDIAKVRVKEKQYRKLLVGRDDRGRHSPGVLDIGLVVIDGQSNLKAPANIYRLSIHGILYCLDVLDLTNKEIDKMAGSYSHVLPGVFGRWNYLKSSIGEDVYRIKLLARGLLLDNVQTTKVSKFPIYEILNYLASKYQNNFEYIEEKDLADQLSLWYYTHLLVPSRLKRKKATHDPWSVLFKKGEGEFREWYKNFLKEVTQFYEERFSVVKNLDKI